MYTRYLTTAGLLVGLATVFSIPAYSAKAGKTEHVQSATHNNSGVSHAESCKTSLDLGCKIVASRMNKMMQQQREPNSTKALAIPNAIKKTHY